jgi:hypothetical protein
VTTTFFVGFSPRSLNPLTLELKGTSADLA